MQQRAVAITVCAVRVSCMLLKSLLVLTTSQEFSKMGPRKRKQMPVELAVDEQINDGEAAYKMEVFLFARCDHCEDRSVTRMPS